MLLNGSLTFQIFFKNLHWNVNNQNGETIKGREGTMTKIDLLLNDNKSGQIRSY